MQIARPAFPTTRFREFLPLSERNGVCLPGSIPGRQIPGDSEVGNTEAQRAFALFSCFGEHLSPGLTDILHENSLRRRPCVATFRFIAYQALLLYHRKLAKSRLFHWSKRRNFRFLFVHYIPICTKNGQNEGKTMEKAIREPPCGAFSLLFPCFSGQKKAFETFCSHFCSIIDA